MQRLFLLPLAFLSTMLASSATGALAGPFDLAPATQRAAQPAGFGETSEPAPPVRRVAAQGEYGGGFLEFLLRGGQQPAREPYRAYPADLGPGMVESSDQPGHLVMDPRFLKQEVGYEGHEEEGTIIINTRERMLYLV